MAKIGNLQVGTLQLDSLSTNVSYLLDELTVDPGDVTLTVPNPYAQPVELYWKNAFSISVGVSPGYDTFDFSVSRVRDGKSFFPFKNVIVYNGESYSWEGAAVDLDAQANESYKFACGGSYSSASHNITNNLWFNCIQI